MEAAPVVPYRIAHVGGEWGILAPSCDQDNRLRCQYAELARFNLAALRQAGQLTVERAVRSAVVRRVTEPQHRFFPVHGLHHEPTQGCTLLWVGHLVCCEHLPEDYRLAHVQQTGDDELPIALFDCPHLAKGGMMWGTVRIPEYPHVPVLACCDHL